MEAELSLWHDVASMCSVGRRTHANTRIKSNRAGFSQEIIGIINIPACSCVADDWLKVILRRSYARFSQVYLLNDPAAWPVPGDVIRLC